MSQKTLAAIDQEYKAGKFERFGLSNVSPISFSRSQSKSIEGIGTDFHFYSSFSSFLVLRRRSTRGSHSLRREFMDQTISLSRHVSVFKLKLLFIIILFSQNL